MKTAISKKKTNTAAAGNRFGIFILASLVFFFVLGFIENTGPFIGHVFVVIAAVAASLVILWAGELLKILTGNEQTRILNQNQSHHSLEEEKERILITIKELDFDFAMGKINERDYQEQRENYESLALKIMRILEKDIEYWKTKAKQTAHDYLLSKRASESLDSPKESTQPDRTTKRISCPACSTGNEADALYCKACGKKCGYSS